MRETYVLLYLNVKRPLNESKHPILKMGYQITYLIICYRQILFIGTKES